MVKFQLGGTTAIFAKAFTEEEGSSLAAEIITLDVVGKRVVIIDHPPTSGLIPLIEGLIAAGAQVHLRDHHAGNPRDERIVARCRELLGDHARVTTRDENPACSTLVEIGEFSGDIIVADTDQDGLTASLKAAGVSYAELDSDAAVLDGPATGKMAENLSPLGFKLVRAWGAIPAFGTPSRDQVFVQVAESFASAAQGEQTGFEALDLLAVDYERNVVSSKELATKATELFPGFRFLGEIIPHGVRYDPPTLTTELDQGMLVSGRTVASGPIGKIFGTQISLARTKGGEKAGINLAELVPSDWGRGPEAGVISNTPFLLHLSPERWEQFQSILRERLK